MILSFEVLLTSLDSCCELYIYSSSEFSFEVWLSSLSGLSRADVDVVYIIFVRII